MHCKCYLNESGKADVLKGDPRNAISYKPLLEMDAGTRNAAPKNIKEIGAMERPCV